VAREKERERNKKNVTVPVHLLHIILRHKLIVWKTGQFMISKIQIHNIIVSVKIKDIL